MVTIAISILVATDRTSISGALRGYHWCLCTKENLHFVEEGMIGLAKLPLPSLDTMIKKYLSVKDIETWVPTAGRSEKAEILKQRNRDIGALTRLVFLDVPSGSKRKWFGPGMAIADQGIWTYDKGSYRIKEMTIVAGFMASFDAQSEYLYFRGKLRRRFTVSFR